MPDGSPIWSDEETQQMLKKLDAQIKIPEIPDAQAVFDRAEKQRGKVTALRVTRFAAAAAAVVLICISLPVLNTFGAKGFSTDSNGFAKEQSTYFAVRDEAAYENETADIAPEAGEANLEEGDDTYNDGLYAAKEDDDESTDSLEAALEAYFGGNLSAGGNPVTGGTSDGGTDIAKTDSYRESLNKKRVAEVEINEDSVSLILYDVSGQSEILAALWIEGTLEDARIVDGSYVLTLNKKISKEEFDSGYYLPMIGSEKTGTGYIDKDSIEIADEIVNAMFTISIYMDIGTGEYEIYTILS